MDSIKYIEKFYWNQRTYLEDENNYNTLVLDFNEDLFC